MVPETVVSGEEDRSRDTDSVDLEVEVFEVSGEEDRSRDTASVDLEVEVFEVNGEEDRSRDTASVDLEVEVFEVSGEEERSRDTTSVDLEVNGEEERSREVVSNLEVVKPVWLDLGDLDHSRGEPAGLENELHVLARTPDVFGLHRQVYKHIH